MSSSLHASSFDILHFALGRSSQLQVESYISASLQSWHVDNMLSQTTQGNKMLLVADHTGCFFILYKLIAAAGLKALQFDRNEQLLHGSQHAAQKNSRGAEKTLPSLSVGSLLGQVAAEHPRIAPAAARKTQQLPAKHGSASGTAAGGGFPNSNACSNPVVSPGAPDAVMWQSAVEAVLAVADCVLLTHQHLLHPSFPFWRFDLLIEYVPGAHTADSSGRQETADQSIQPKLLQHFSSRHYLFVVQEPDLTAVDDTCSPPVARGAGAAVRPSSRRVSGVKRCAATVSQAAGKWV